MRYTIRQVLLSSWIRSSWHLFPIEGIGRECGRDNLSPACKRRKRNPASILASLEKGGVFTSPWSHTSGLSVLFIQYKDMSFLTYSQVANSQTGAIERLTRQTRMRAKPLRGKAVVQYFCPLKWES